MIPFLQRELLCKLLRKWRQYYWRYKIWCRDRKLMEKLFFFFAFVWLNKLSTPYYSFIIILHGRQPKVILTNVLRTKIGRKYTQAQPKTDANFSDAGKLQSNQPPSSSVASLKIWQILNPALHSPFLSKRYVVFALCH